MLLDDPMLLEQTCALIIERHYNAEWALRSEEHTSELQALMRISYAGFLLKKKKKKTIKQKIKANNGTNKIKNNINKNKKLNTTVFKAEIVITNNKHITKHKKSTII